MRFFVAKEGIGICAFLLAASPFWQPVSASAENPSNGVENKRVDVRQSEKIRQQSDAHSAKQDDALKALYYANKERERRLRQEAQSRSLAW